MSVSPVAGLVAQPGSSSARQIAGKATVAPWMLVVGGGILGALVGVLQVAVFFGF